MLQAIRDRAQGIFAWVMLILIGVPFALWGIQNYLDVGKEKPAAEVGGHEISDRDVSRVYEQSMASLVDLGDIDEKQLRHEALERLIRDEVIAQAAQERNLIISDEDVRSYIQTAPYFQTDGKFDKDKYKAMLAGQGLNPAGFAEQVRHSLLLSQFQKGVALSGFVTPDQVDAMVRLSRQEREIEFITIPIKKSEREIPQSEIEAYYQTHLEEFRIPEKVSIDYILVSLAELAKGITATEEDLRKAYEEQKAGFSEPERRRVSHILVSADGKADQDDAALLGKANALRDRLAKGEEFAKLAKESSADPASAAKGGDLGYLTQSGFDPAFAEAAGKLKQGELSEPVKTSFGYHLIKLTELTPATSKSFEQVRAEIQETYQRNAAEGKYYELGEKLGKFSFEHPESLEPVAKEVAAKVQSTGEFTRDVGEGIAAEAKIREAAFSDDVQKGRNSDPIELDDNRAVVLRMKAHIPSTDKPLEQVKADIVAKLRQQDAQRQAREQADGLKKKVVEGTTLADAAKSAGLSVNKTGWVRRNAEKQPPALLQVAFKQPRPAAGQSSPPGIVELEPGGSLALYSVVNVKDGVIPGEAKDKAQEQESLQRGLGQRELEAFIDALRATADVKVYAAEPAQQN